MAAALDNNFERSIEIPLNNGKYEQPPEDVATNLYQEISQQFPHFKNVPQFYFGELVDNSYDGYRQFSLKGGTNPDGQTRLIVKAIVQRSDVGVTVKLEDNGTGFPNREKGVQFMYEKKKDRVRKADQQGMIGGMGAGLEGFIEKVEKAGGFVFIENKQAGCSIQAMFPM